MSYIGERPAIATGIDIAGELLVVITRTGPIAAPDGEPRHLSQRDVLSPFRPIRSEPGKTVPIGMDKRLAMIFAQIVEEQVAKINAALDFIEQHGWLAFDMSIGKVTA
ncbi:MAG TPA: hypothetical protein VF409_07600 [Sphingomonas sp.]